MNAARVAGLTALLIMGMAPAWAAASPVVVAVFDIDDRSGRFRSEEVDQLTAYLAIQVADGPAFRVVPRAQVRAAMADAKRESYKDCYDDRCQIEIGRALAAQKSLLTRIISIGSRCAVTAALFDLGTEASEQAVSQKTNCDRDALVTALEQVATSLKARSVGGRDARPTASVAAEAPPSEGGPNVGAWTSTALAVAGLGVGVGFTLKAIGHESNANDPNFVGAQQEVSAAETAELISFFGYGVAGAAGVTALLLWILDDDAPSGSIAVTPGPNGASGVGIVGRF